ncbi:transglutaminase-like cysteine peptidase [Mesorhizobium sp. M1076]
MVRQSSGEGHAMLSVNTTAGDFILDNLERRSCCGRTPDIPT